MRTILSSVLALMLGATPAALLIATAQAQISVSIRVAPPPLPYYEQPAIPAEGYLWVPGYWYWDASENDYYWVPERGLSLRGAVYCGRLHTGLGREGATSSTPVIGPARSVSMAELITVTVTPAKAI